MADKASQGTGDWTSKAEKVHGLLRNLSFWDADAQALPVDAGFSVWCRYTEEVRKDNGTIYLVGNGASASMASHMAADLAKNARLHTQVFSDLSLITAVANDMGYEHVFSEPLSRRGGGADMLVAISSSGRSPNVLAATRTARRLSMTIVTLSAMDLETPLRSAGDLNAWLPCRTYGDAETCHATVLHHWMDLVEIPGAGRIPG